jgi:nucleotide-binding universal stress UspA family protein
MAADQGASPTAPEGQGPRTRKLLVIADESPECRLALRYAARRAQHTGGRLSLLYVSVPSGFEHWMAVEARMREEAREEAEKLLHALAGEVNRVANMFPELVIREGQKKDEIAALIKEDPSIALLVLGAGTGREGPGPLVSGLSSDIASVYPIPVTIVPGTMSEAEIDAIA